MEREVFPAPDGEPVAAAHPGATCHRPMGAGSGSISTLAWPVEKNVCYCFLSYAGAKAAKAMMDGYWDVVERKGLEKNPYRAGFLQLVAVSETDAGRKRSTPTTVEYFYHKCLHVPAQWFAPPGNQDYRSLLAAQRNPVRRAEVALRYRDFVEKGYVMPAEARHRARSVDRGSGRGAPSGQSDDPGADQLHAARADQEEHQLFARERGSRCGSVGRRRLGEPLVARAAADHATAGGRDALTP